MNEIYTAFVNEVLTRFDMRNSTNIDTKTRFVMNYIFPLYTYSFNYEKKYEQGNKPEVINGKFIYVYDIIFELK